MRNRITKMILPLTFCMALAVGAQAKNNSKHSSSSTQGKKMTVTGCLQTGSTPDTFVLNNVDNSMHGSSAQSGHSGQTPGAMARSEGTSYTLIPSGNVSLQNYVGQRVRITGRMASDTSMSHGSSTSGSSSSSSSSRSQSGNDMSSGNSSSSFGSELMVTSVKKAAGTCQ